MDYIEFNRRALSALNHYPKKDRLLILRKVADYTKHYGYQAAVKHLLPALEKGDRNAKTLGNQHPPLGLPLPRSKRR